MNSNYYCVIMAGGSGTRFWPMSRAAKPKQFLDILGQGKSFLRATFYRFAHIVPLENIYVVTSEQYASMVAEQLPQMPADNILKEPYKRNTAPCIAYATYKIRKKNPEATVVITPSDHHIVGEDNFAGTIQCALDEAAQLDRIFTIGIQPTRPDTNYGYIQINPALYKNVGGHEAYGVKTFTEKPDAAMARLFLETGEFLWNSGMFISSVKTLAREFETCMPQMAAIFSVGDDKYSTPAEPEFVKHAYQNCESISIDYGMMEKTKMARVLKADFLWSDIGTWTSVYEHSPNKNADANVIKAAESIVADVHGSIIQEDNKSKLVVVRGLEDFLVVDTPDVLMICPKNDKTVKDILADLAAEDKSRFM